MSRNRKTGVASPLAGIGACARCRRTGRRRAAGAQPVRYPAGRSQLRNRDISSMARAAAYEIILKAFAAGDRGGLRPLLSDEVYTAFDARSPRGAPRLPPRLWRASPMRALSTRRWRASPPRSPCRSAPSSPGDPYRHVAQRDVTDRLDLRAPDRRVRSHLDAGRNQRRACPEAAEPSPC